MARAPVPAWFFVVTVVRRDREFLLVHEREHGRPWYLPAGRVEPGEPFLDAARRETLEEAGISIEVDGLIRVEHSHGPVGTRVRVVLSARPADDTPLKSEPDAESLGAGWFTLEEMRELSLRGGDVIEVAEWLLRGGRVAPLDVLAREGAPYPAATAESEED
jgi:phosphatase NudJ